MPTKRLSPDFWRGALLATVGSVMGSLWVASYFRWLDKPLEPLTVIIFVGISILFLKILWEIYKKASEENNKRIRVSRESPKQQAIKALFSVFVLFIVVFFIHEFGHVVAQFFFGIPISIGFSWFIITTTAGTNLLDYPFIMAFVILISGFVVSLIPMPYLRKIIFIPKRAKEKIDVEKFTFNLYLAFCVSISLWDFFVIFLLFMR